MLNREDLFGDKAFEMHAGLPELAHSTSHVSLSLSVQHVNAVQCLGGGGLRPPPLPLPAHDLHASFDANNVRN
jgi:hypothetical protein